MSQRGREVSGREQCRGNTVTLHYSRHLHLLSSSNVRSTTSAGDAQVCWGVAAVHAWLCLPGANILHARAVLPWRNTLNHTSSRMNTPEIEMKSKSMVNPTEGKMASVVLTNTFTKINLLCKFIKPITNIPPPFPPSLHVCLSPHLSQFSLKNAKIFVSATKSWVTSRSVLKMDKMMLLWIHLSPWGLQDRAAYKSWAKLRCPDNLSLS